MYRLIYFFYATVGLIAIFFLIKSWVEESNVNLPYREPIHRRW